MFRLIISITMAMFALLIMGCDIHEDSEDGVYSKATERGGHRVTKDELPPELVLYMPFESDTITGREVKDITSYGNNGIIINDPKIVKGYRGDALDFTNDSIEVGISESLSRTVSEITMEVWAFARTRSMNDIISRWDYDRDGIIHLEVRAGGQIRFCMRNDDNLAFIDLTTATSFPAGEWVHIAATYDGETARIYLNGVQVANRGSIGIMRDNDAVRLWIGSMHGADRWFDGMIDEVCIWSKALNPEEIRKSMDGTLISGG